MGLRGIYLDMSGGQLSDLFFNFEHPAYDKLYAGIDPKQPGPGGDAIEAAIKDDAKEFLLVLGVKDEPDFIEELAADFLKRV